jgi:pyruvate formate lyase activating enzyme
VLSPGRFGAKRFYSREKGDGGLISNIQRFSLHDGPGIRTTVFFKGCPLNCKWCSNPESINAHPEIMVYDRRCLIFKKCIDVCPTGAISIVDNARAIDRSKCNDCMECAKVCPSAAIEQVGSVMTKKELMSELVKDELFYLNSGGGVTLSGGEPLLQWEFVRDVLNECKQRNFSTALDTSGYARWAVLEKVLDLVDLFLYDIKHLDPEMHRQGTGVSNELILNNFRKVAQKAKIWLRFPLIPGFNDSKELIRRLAELGAEFRVEKVSLLPYHNWGEQKYGRLGRDYSYKGIPLLGAEQVQEFKAIVESYGLITSIGN